MTEIEKLYSLAGCKKIFCDCTKCKKTDCISEDIDQDTCVTLTYSPFTAKKQLELIKFLFNHSVLYDVDDKENYWFHISDDCYTYHYNKFEIALANIINEMWQDLTEAEQNEIRNILEE